VTGGGEGWPSTRATLGFPVAAVACPTLLAKPDEAATKATPSFLQNFALAAFAVPHFGQMTTSAAGGT